MTQEENVQEIEKQKEEQTIDKAIRWLNVCLTDNPAKNCRIPITKDAKEDLLNKFRNYMKEEHETRI